MPPYDPWDVAALLAHIDAALIVADRMNTRRAGSVTTETVHNLRHIGAECHRLLESLTDGVES